MTYEISVRIHSINSENIEILKELLVNLGVDRSQITECIKWPHTFLAVYYNVEKKAQAFKKKLCSLHLHDVRIGIKRLRKKDWQTKWKREFKPFKLTKSFGVIPMHLKGKHSFRKQMPIYIDTDVAFGTGLHATTRFMAQFVERCQGKFKSFYDVGTGTGILAMIASKCGADDVQAVDISSESVNVARENFKINNCSSVEVRVADAHKLKSKKKFDFVCANIITQDLIQMADQLIALVKPGKYLAVSGISLSSYDVFRQSYAEYPLRCVKIMRGEGWVAILFKKLQHKE